MMCRISIEYTDLYAGAPHIKNEAIVNLYYYNECDSLYEYEIARIFINLNYDTNKMLNMEIKYLIDNVKDKYYQQEFGGASKTYLDTQIEKYGKINLSLH